MKKSFGVGAVALGLISLGLVAVPAPAQAAGSVAVVDIAVWAVPFGGPATEVHSRKTLCIIVQ